MKPIQLRPSKKDATPSLSIITPLGVVRIQCGLQDEKHREVVVVGITPDTVPGAPRVTVQGSESVKMTKAKEAIEGQRIERREWWLVTQEEWRAILDRESSLKMNGNDLFLGELNHLHTRRGVGVRVGFDLQRFPYLMNGEGRIETHTSHPTLFKKITTVIHDEVGTTPAAAWVRVVCDKAGNYIRPVRAGRGRPKAGA